MFKKRNSRSFFSLPMLGLISLLIFNSACQLKKKSGMLGGGNNTDRNDDVTAKGVLKDGVASYYSEIAKIASSMEDNSTKVTLPQAQPFPSGNKGVRGFQQNGISGARAYFDVNLQDVCGKGVFIDLFIPGEGVKNGIIPLVMGLHGGAWKGGGTTRMRKQFGPGGASDWTTYLVSRGIAVMNVDYGLDDPNQVWGSTSRVICSFFFIAYVGRSLNIRIDYTVGLGISAGAHLASLLATSKIIRGAVSLAGVANLESYYYEQPMVRDLLEKDFGGPPKEGTAAYLLYWLLSPVRWQRASGDPGPVHAYIGNQDTIVPFSVPNFVNQCREFSDNDPRAGTKDGSFCIEVVDDHSFGNNFSKILGDEFGASGRMISYLGLDTL